MWWAAVPRDQWVDGARPDEQPDWHPRFGDRTQTLVFIGQSMDEAAFRARLDACLLEERLALGSSREWLELSNPFPTIEMAAAPA